MDNPYKLSISNRNIYKEIELSEDLKQLRIGTSVENDVRLIKDPFFEEISLNLFKIDGNWMITADDNLYFLDNGIQKQVTRKIKHGDSLSVHYQSTGNEAFKLSFSIDFEKKPRLYDRVISLKNQRKITIGSSGQAQIILESPYAKNTKVVLTPENNWLRLVEEASDYGVMVNGARIHKSAGLREGDFFSIADCSFYFKNTCLYTDSGGSLSINGLSCKDISVPKLYPMFRQNTRIKKVLDEEEIEVLDPPQLPQKPRQNIIITLLPSLGMLAISGGMALMGGSMMIFSLLSGGIAIITAVANIIDTRRNYKKQVKERKEKYTAYIENKEKEIDQFRNQELNVLNSVYVDKETELRNLNSFSSDLFDRQPGDDDYLQVRLGTGAIEARKAVGFKKQERLEIEDDLQLEPQRIYENNKYIQNAPVVLSLKDINAVGIAGNEEQRYEILKIMVLDLISRQFYTDVKFLFVGDEHIDRLKKFRILPHIQNADTGTRNLVCDAESKNLLFEYLYKRFTGQENTKKDTVQETLVLFFYDEFGFKTHPISKYVQQAKDLGIVFVFFADSREELPLGCDELILIDDAAHAQLVKSANGDQSVLFEYSPVSDAEIMSAARILAPVKREEISLESTLTKNISMFELLNILSADDIDLARNWESSKVYETMDAPLGVSKSGLVSLNLHDKFHGPHGLVAGTTGSGKSEILQSYILSIASLYHPHDVGFLIIDFKGGGMVNQFRDLPHLLGAITNIDGKQIDRSLMSIKAELQRRQKLFADAEVNHIDKYIQKYKQGGASVPLPHLIIIVDEFAELKAEQPDFMKELISAARIGRSLGVHLILATQKPAGQVDDQIWSNSRFKLCLKVQSMEDSNEVLKSPLAAEIKEPGRAYLQVGNNEIFELFQSAYSGDSEKVVETTARPFKIQQVSLSGKKSVVYSKKVEKNNSDARTQLEAIVDHVYQYCKEADIEKLPNICLEALPETVSFPEVYKNRDGLMDIGILDNPENQFQGSTWLDITGRHTFVLGSSQYGKTTLLQSLIRGIAATYSPKQANIYILDFGSMVLKNFESLHHVGGVVCPSEDEKLMNLFKLLNGEVTYRKEKMLQFGLSSYTAYLEAGYQDIPRIFIFIDNLTSLNELYLQDNDTLLGIIREGLAVGISVIAANAQTSGVGYKYLSNFANKISFTCNDTNEYANLFDHVTTRPDPIPGRAILEHDKQTLELQTYLSFEGEKEVERVKSIQTFIQETNRTYPGQRARKIPFIPNVLEETDFIQDFSAVSDGSRLPVGLTYEDVVPYYLNLETIGSFGLCGKENTGHRNFLRYILNTLSLSQRTYPVSVYIVDDIHKKLNGFQNLDIVDKYTANPGDIKAIVESLHEILTERYQKLIDGTLKLEQEKMQILIVQNNDAAKQISDDYMLLNKYNELLDRFKSLKIAVIFSDYQNAAVSFDAPEPLRRIKNSQHILLFDNLSALKAFDPPYEELRRHKKKLQMGDAFYINDGNVTKLKMVKAGMYN